MDIEKMNEEFNRLINNWDCFGNEVEDRIDLSEYYLQRKSV